MQGDHDPQITHRVQLTDAEIKARRSRNLAIGWSLAAMVVIFLLATYLKFDPSVVQQPQ